MSKLLKLLLGWFVLGSLLGGCVTTIGPWSYDGQALKAKNDGVTVLTVDPADLVIYVVKSIDRVVEQVVESIKPGNAEGRQDHSPPPVTPAKAVESPRPAWKT